MASPLRFIQDTYSSAAKFLGHRPEICRLEDPGWYEQKWNLQKPGSCDFDNTLDDRVGGNPGATQTYHWPQIDCFRVRDATVVGDEGQVYLSDGRLLLPSIFPYKIERVRLRKPLPFYKTIDAPVFHLTGVHHFNHGHFNQEYIPRVVAARELLPRELFDQLHFLLAPKHLDWQSHMLKYLGIRADRIIPATHGTLRLRDMYIAPMCEHRVDPIASPELQAQVVKCFAGIPPGQPAPVLFLSRRDAPWRRMQNEDELILATEKLLGPTKVVTFGNMTFEEQIAAMKSARIIIGVLGQALSNMLYLEGKTLIVLIPGTLANDHTGVAHWFLAMLSHNRVLTLRCGQENIDLKNWAFPLPAYETQLTRALSQDLLSDPHH